MYSVDSTESRENKIKSVGIEPDFNALNVLSLFAGSLGTLDPDIVKLYWFQKFLKVQESIEHDYIRIERSWNFQQIRNSRDFEESRERFST